MTGDQARSGAQPEPELAEVDVLLERTDLGPGAATLIVKGDPIPPELAGLPRRPRAPKPAPKPRGRRR
jgi:hypothetical protein